MAKRRSQLKAKHFWLFVAALAAEAAVRFKVIPAQYEALRNAVDAVAFVVIGVAYQLGVRWDPSGREERGAGAAPPASAASGE